MQALTSTEEEKGFRAMVPGVPRSDEDLIAAIQDGDKDAVTHFEKRHAAFLHDIYRRLDPLGEQTAPPEHALTLIDALPMLLAHARSTQAWEACLATATIAYWERCRTAAAIGHPIIADQRSDTVLVSSIAAGDTTAILSFKARHAAQLLNICKGLTVNDGAKREAFRELILEADLPTLFSDFTGKGTWSTFVKAAVINRFLFPRLMQRIIDDDETDASADFEAYFRLPVSRIAQGATSDKILAEDISQSVFQVFFTDNCAKLKTYATRASSQGLIILAIEYLVRNLAAKYGPAETRKRTLPTSIKKLSPFDQDVFRQFYWKHARSTELALLALQPRYRHATEGTIVEAQIRIEKAARSKHGIFIVDGETEELQEEFIASEQETSEDAGAQAIREAVLLVVKSINERKNQPAYLSSENKERYLRERLNGKSAAEIAGILDLTDTQVYALGRSVTSKLRKALTVQTLYASLYKDAVDEPVHPRSDAGAALPLQTFKGPVR